MPVITKLSEIIYRIDEAIRNKFEGKVFWITAEISSVNKILNKRWCFLDFTEKSEFGETCIKGVCWARNYLSIELFENITGIEFKSGIEITCKVCISFYKVKSYPQLEILEIDYAYAVGKSELEKRLTIEKLIKENASIIRLPDGRYLTKNNSIEVPAIIQRIALITAPDSDGQRDFKTIIQNNKYGYDFFVKEFLQQIQGNNAKILIIEKLKLIYAEKDNYDAVVIVRGGGSDNDFHCFNDYELSRFVAMFPIPVLTGIGHDRNTSIVDLMARQHRTPTEVATFIVNTNFNFEFNILQLQERIFKIACDLLENAKNTVNSYKQRVKNLSPSTILKKGFAIVTSDGKIVTDPKTLKLNSEIKTILKKEIIHSTITKKSKNENRIDIQ